MCLLAIAYQHHPQYPLIVVANRDEFYARPTAPLQWWEDTDRTVLAGRDLKDGGTWMGMSVDGKFAALTNYRSPEHMRPDAPSRGKLVRDFLTGAMPMDEMIRFLRTQGRNFNGFNLLYGKQDELYYYSNVNDRHQQLYPGVYGLSNAFLDTPWPKVSKLKTAFSASLIRPDAEEAFLDMMTDDQPAPDALLPNTGVPPEWEKRLSPLFITSPDYGTRLTTFVSVDQGGTVVYREKGYVPESDNRYTFALQP